MQILFVLFAYQIVAEITILEPQEVIDAFISEELSLKIDASFAEFGHIPFGSSITGLIYYDAANPQGCKRIDNLSSFTETADLTPIPPEANSQEDSPPPTGSLQNEYPAPLVGFNETSGMSAQEEQGPSLNGVKVPKILLVDRGECSFVTKVRNGERAGASTVIVIDDRFEDIQDVIMSDDGTGYNVRVPSMIIDKVTGSLLK